MEKRSMFVGMDVHKESIDISVAEEGRQGEVRHYGVIAGANPLIGSPAGLFGTAVLVVIACALGATGPRAGHPDRTPHRVIAQTTGLDPERA